MRARASIAARLLAPLLLAAAAPAAAAECLVYRAPIAFGADVQFQAMASSGVDCRVRVPAIAGFATETNEIVTRPRYGGVRVDAARGAYYRSNPGYRGRDDFAFRLCGHRSGKSACSTVRVWVQVR